jgi:hypothetical protein
MRALACLAVLALVAAGCTAGEAGTLRFHPAPAGSQAATLLSAQTLQQLSAPIRSAIQAAYEGRDVTIGVSQADLDAARDVLDCKGTSVFSYRDVLIACENARVR